MIDLPGGIILTGGAASLPGVVDLAQDVFETNVKLHVPNHMGLRNPVFTNVISIVDYTAELNEVYRLAKAAVMGEKEVTPVAPQPAVVQPQVQQEAVYDNYESNEEYYEEPDSPKSGEKVTGKLKDFFSNIFD